MELIFETDRQAMQRTLWLPILRKVDIERLDVFDGGVEECVVETVGLYDQLSRCNAS